MKRWQQLCYKIQINRLLIWQLRFNIFCSQSINCEDSFGIPEFSGLNKEELQGYAFEAILRNLPENLSAVLEYTHVFDDIIDDMIQCAIDTQQHECYLILLNYKYQNHLFQDEKLELL